jgi:hypothetical protein
MTEHVQLIDIGHKVRQTVQQVLGDHSISSYQLPHLFPASEGAVFTCEVNQLSWKVMAKSYW